MNLSFKTITIISSICSLLLITKIKFKKLLLITKTKFKKLNNGNSNLIVLGSGSSTGTPFLACLIGLLPRTLRNQDRKHYHKTSCKVCLDAYNNPNSKNKRNNPAICINYKNKTILIDFGKTIRDSMLKYFTKYNIKGIDSVLITHAHAGKKIIIYYS